MEPAPDTDPVAAIGALLDHMRVLLEQIRQQAERLREQSTPEPR